MKKGMDLPPSFRAAADAGLAPVGNVSLQALEITQVVQDLNHSVPLIAKKPTVVRAYFDRPAGSSPITIRGVLRVGTSATGTSQTIASLNKVVVNPADNGNLRAKRENLSLSLNFLLPASAITAGQRHFSIRTVNEAGSGQAVPVTNPSARTVRFLKTPPLRVRLILLRYSTGSPPEVHLPTTLDRALVKSWLKRAYPVAEVILSEVTVDSNNAWEFNCDQVNAQLSAIRNLDVSNGGVDHRTHYYGLVADGNGANFMRGCAAIPVTPNPAAVGSGPTGAADFGWDEDGSYGDWYTGHELGHTFGRWHPGSGCGESSNDPNFPYPDGQISDSNGTFVGFDAGDNALGLPMAALPGAQWHDVMTYCSRQWLSYYTYNAIRDRLVAEDALGSGLAADDAGAEFVANAAATLEVMMDSGDFINVIGIVNLTRETGKIEYVNPVSKVLVPESVDESPVTIREKNSDNEVLREIPAQIKLNSCANPDEDQTAIVDFVTPYNPEIAALELLINGKIVDTFSPGALETPNISLLSAVSADTSTELAWDAAADADSNIRYNVQVSDDDGASWETVAVGKTTPDLTIDREQFQAAERLQVRVIATNGFRSSIVTTQDLPLDES